MQTFGAAEGLGDAKKPKTAVEVAQDDVANSKVKLKAAEQELVDAEASSQDCPCAARKV